MKRCDAVIVGGGPGGSTCARALRRAGLDVVVIDKQPFPREKVCAGWVTPAVLEELGVDRVEYGAGRTIQPITAFEVGVLGGRMRRIAYGEPVSFGIRRREFDEFLLRRSGAELRLGEPLRTMERRDGMWEINGEVETPLVIGAGGHFCPVARRLNPGLDETRVVVAQEIEVPVDELGGRCAVEPSTPELYFYPDLMGYAWCFGKRGHVNIGVGREDPGNLAGHVRRFVEHLVERGRIPPIERRFKGYAYILYGHTRRRITGEGVMLIGDAAGLAYPASGEGIRAAVESALLAAGVAVESRGDFSGESLRRYAIKLTEHFGKPGPGEARPSRWKQWAAGRAMDCPLFVRYVLLDRWFLARHRPVCATAR